jgi:ADP-ribose pyrophosphatase
MQSMARELLFEGKHLRLVRDGRWEYAERTKASGAAVIVALTDENHLILIEQFRVPIGKRVIELPAGLVGDLDGAEQEDMAEAARRELIEETGYDAGEMTFLTMGPPTAGLATELVSFFLATKLKRVGAGGGDETEQIQVHEVPLVEVPAWIHDRASADLLVDPKVYAGLYFAGAASQR